MNPLNGRPAAGAAVDPLTAGWPPGLRSVVRILLTSRFSMWMGWGPDLAFFYNDAYRRDTLREKHPWALGRPAREVWAEIWDDVGARIGSVMETGEATWDEGLQLFIERSGYLAPRAGRHLRGHRAHRGRGVRRSAGGAGARAGGRPVRVDLPDRSGRGDGPPGSPTTAWSTTRASCRSTHPLRPSGRRRPASTAVCVVLDTDTGELRWARAGHPPPLITDTELATAAAHPLVPPGR